MCPQEDESPRVGGARLFLALWPPPEARTRIAALSEQLAMDDGRRVAPVNLHITLVFLGNCDAARRECVERAAVCATVAEFSLHLTDVQWRRRTGIVWLTTPKTPEPLVRLAAFLNGALESCGHEPDPRAFRPHVTIARDVRRFRGTPAIAAIDWRVRDYCLVESILTARGSDYAVRRRWPLRREVQTGNGKY